MQQVFYRIADQYIVFHTPDAEATVAMLPNYAPFRQESLPNGEEVLLEVWGDCACCDPSEEHLLESAEDYQYKSKIYQLAGGGRQIAITMQNHTEIGCFSPDWRVLRCRSSLTNQGARYLIDRLTMIAFTMATNKLRMVKFHASVTKLGEKALLFLGVSGTGKSTHSRLWREYVEGATLLNDDEPIVRVMPDGSIRVYGCPWSGSTPCYKDEWAEVAAFVHLYQSSENKLTKLPGRQAFDSLFSSSAFMLSDKANRMQVFNNIADILNKVSVYQLDCRPDEGAVALTRTLM